jgi:hypothetical protein
MFSLRRRAHGCCQDIGKGAGHFDPSAVKGDFLRQAKFPKFSPISLLADA